MIGNREWKKLVGCEGKQRFAGRGIAARVAKRMRRRYGESVEAYHCVICHAWHVGSSVTRRARRLRIREKKNEQRT